MKPYLALPAFLPLLAIVACISACALDPSLGNESPYADAAHVPELALIDGMDSWEGAGLGFAPQPSPECGLPATPISQLQGRGALSPLEGRELAIEAVISADFRARGAGGIFVQEDAQDEDGDPATSEGLFLTSAADSSGGGGGGGGAMEGLRVRARGIVRELDGVTALDSSQPWAFCPGTAELDVRSLRLPVSSDASLEALEGMRVQIAQPLTVTGNLELGRFGSLDLAADGRIYAPTQLLAAGPAARALRDQDERRGIVLDDASFDLNPQPVPYLDAQGTRRVGDAVRGLLGILDDRFGAYRVHPLEAPSFERSAERPREPPALPGRLRIASLNLRNYFTTLDTGAPACGPSADQPCRGASDVAGLARQRAKLVSALAALNADVLGLLELQNDGGASLADLVAALNERLARDIYVIVPTGVLGRDAIASGMAYRRARVATVGSAAVLTRALDREFDEAWHRPALAQTFVELETGAHWNLVLVHLKSKATPCDGDPDLEDGQGACNRTRTAAARALARFVARDPTGSGDPDTLLIGDFNAYAREDPIAALEAAGLRPLIAGRLRESDVSYQFGAQSGTLDHAFATASLAAQVGGAAHWHIAADEPSVLDYQAAASHPESFAPDEPYRASDHDPLLIVLNLSAARPIWPKLQIANLPQRLGFP